MSIFSIRYEVSSSAGSEGQGLRVAGRNEGVTCLLQGERREMHWKSRQCRCVCDNFVGSLHSDTPPIQPGPRAAVCRALLWAAGPGPSGEPGATGPSEWAGMWVRKNLAQRRGGPCGSKEAGAALEEVR